ncbi:uncharacterized protein LOC111273097 [Varroa jacobsoni]|uniref:Uncharacterized protein n=1 Tax=Varroa destructor TaxID=109461 RepID=A0A7M7JSX1_VARDE|nr:uncharacterized protein LOC111245925 [Varroa destructor]XP_022710521.1 uncharacterized protein LOC111273097 [Varroa jacobsoni]
MELTRILQYRLWCFGAVFMGIAACAYYIFDPNLLYFIGRKFLIALLSFYDWTVLNRRSCAIANPWYITPPPSPKECLACEDLTAVPEVSYNVSSTRLYEHFLDTRIPVVVRGGYIEHASGVQLENVIRTIQDNLSAKVCAFRSNTPWTFDRFLEQTTSMESFYALWENCNEESKKLMRRFYHRPDRIPAAVELTGYSWVALSRRFLSAKPKILDFAGGSVGIWIQIEGRSRIQLEQRRCHCRLDLDLNMGDYLVVRIDGWNVSFTPADNNGDSVAFIPTGYLQ